MFLYTWKKKSYKKGIKEEMAEKQKLSQYVLNHATEQLKKYSIIYLVILQIKLTITLYGRPAINLKNSKRFNISPIKTINDTCGKSNKEKANAFTEYLQKIFKYYPVSDTSTRKIS